MIRRPPRSTQSRSSAASDVYKRQAVSGDADSWMGLAVIGEDGLHLFKPMETLREIPRENQRRAFPLTAIFADRTMDITESTRPGMQTVFASSDNPITIPLDQNQENSSEILFYPGALTFSSPESGSWVWARSTNLNYTGSWNLASLDHGICLLYTSPSPRDATLSRMPSSA